MDRYLYKKSKNYRKLNYLKRVLGSRKDLEYLYKIEGTSKRDFGYNILLEEMDKMFLDLGKMNLKNWLSILVHQVIMMNIFMMHLKKRLKVQE